MSKIKLKSWKGDYLHRPDSDQGVTTSSTGVGNEWELEFITAEELPTHEDTGSHLVKLGPQGSSVKGTTYDIQPKNELLRSRIKSLRINAGWAIDKIQVEYETLIANPVKPHPSASIDAGGKGGFLGQLDTCWAVKQIPVKSDTVVKTPSETYVSIDAGGKGGTPAQFLLEPDDYITEIVGSWGRQAPGYPQQGIVTLQFKTNKGITSQVFGGGNPQKQVEPFSLKAPQDHEIIGFFGEHGNQLYSLGVYLKPTATLSLKPNSSPTPTPNISDTPKPINPTPTPTPSISDTLKPEAITSAIHETALPGKILGVGTDKQLYTRDTLTSPWTQVPNSGSVIDVTILRDGTILGIGTDNQLYTRATLNSSWVNVPNSGSILGIAVLNDGTILGIGMDYQLYTKATLTAPWVHIPNSGSVLGITILTDGTILGIGMDYQLYTKATLTAPWVHIPNSGSVLGITVLPSGKILGIGTNNQLYTRDTLTSPWINVPNSAAVIAITGAEAIF